jgi:hypothetical protein
MIEQKSVIQNVLPAGQDAEEFINDSFGKAVDAYQLYKWITSFFIVAMLLAAIITTYMVEYSRVMFGVYVLLWICAIIASVPLSNTYEELQGDATLGPSFAGFDGQNFIFAHLPIWVTIVGAIITLIMLANLIKGNNEGGYP